MEKCATADHSGIEGILRIGCVGGMVRFYPQK